MRCIFSICLSVFSLLLLCSASVYSQNSDEYLVTKRMLSVEDGLSSREVYCGTQDTLGFLWFGTRSGLNRYDGKNFLLFTKKRNNLQDDKVIKLATTGNLLFILYGDPGNMRVANGKTDVLDLTTRKVKTLTAAFSQLPFKEKNIIWLSENQKGIVHFTTVLPFEYWQYDGKEFKLLHRLPEKNYLEQKNHFRGLANFSLSKQGFAYLSLTDPVWITPDTFFTKEHFPANEKIHEPFGISDDNAMLMTLICKGKPNEYKMYADGRLEKTTKYAAIAEKLIDNKHILSYPSGNANEAAYKVIGDSSRLYLTDFKVTHSIIDAEEMQQYSDFVVMDVFTDRNGWRWLSTSSGILNIGIKKNRFKHYFTHNQTKLSGAFNQQARGIYADENKVYANMWNDLCISDREGNVSTYTAKNSGLFYALEKLGDTLYTGSYHLFAFNENANKLTVSHKYIDVDELWCLDALDKNTLIAGTSLKLVCIDLNNKEVNEVKYVRSDIPKAKFCYRFFNTKTGELWCVAENGLYVINKKGEVIDYYGEAKDSLHRLPNARLHDAYEDEEGIFWLATNGDGLYRWNRKQHTFMQFDITNGLPSDILYRIEADEFNHLWISSDYGLTRLVKKDFSMRTFTVNDGLSHNEFNRISSFKAADGRLFFGGLNGINAFNPKDFVSDTAAFNASFQVVSFSQFSADNNKLEDKTGSLLTDGKIVIHPGDRFFNMEFKLLDFGNGKERYAYKIEGFDNDWNHIAENTIRVSGLPYGNFTLRVKAQNAAGAWSKDELSFPVEVIKPVYLRTWFIMLVFAAIAASVLLVFKFRTRQLRLAKERLEKTVSERTEELNSTLDEKENLIGQKNMLLKEVHHRVKNNLQVISTLLDMQGKDIDDEKAKKAIVEGQTRVRSIALIHQNLYQHDDLTGIEFGSFFHELAKSIKQVFMKEDELMELEIDIPDVVVDIDTAVPLGLIANELLTNSFKYGVSPDGILRLNAQWKEEGNGCFILVIRDKGRGMPEGFDPGRSKSLGLRMVSRLCEQLGGKLTYYTDHGSVFEVSGMTTEARKEEL